MIFIATDQVERFLLLVDMRRRHPGVLSMPLQVYDNGEMDQKLQLSDWNWGIGRLVIIYQVDVYYSAAFVLSMLRLMGRVAKYL